MIDLLCWMKQPWLRWPLTTLVIALFLAWCFRVLD